MNWTKEQQQAIDQRNANVLVAAAAGSGKTAVLVERIKKIIIDDNVPIDRMLIVTFTNAAATEMKEKIRIAINDEIDKSTEKSDNLRRQLGLIPRANISTFHAFALNVIKQFFYLVDVEPGFSICDDAMGTIMKEDAMDTLLEDAFNQDEESFYEFLDWYSSDRNLNNIREMLNNSYAVLQSMPHPWIWLDKNTKKIKENHEMFIQSDIMDEFWSIIEDIFSEIMDNTKKAKNLLLGSNLTRLAEKIKSEDMEFQTKILGEISKKNIDEIRKLCGEYKTARLSPKKEEKETYESVKDVIAIYRSKSKKKMDELKTTFFYEPIEKQIEEVNETYNMACILSKLLRDFDRLFKKEKESKQYVDFSDIEHYCLSILENEKAAAFYREKFQYIFIDEYQDTNVLQEEIISKIKREDNLFMVGDIKQSIYKFRLAEPEIFKNKYNFYKSNIDDKSIKIDLNRNYRSKSKIIDRINLIFENLMEGYDESARLYPGLDYEGEYNVPPEIRIIDTSNLEDSDDEEIQNLKTAEIEALSVAGIIKEHLGKPFFDSKTGKERNLGKCDIVILLRSARNYAQIFYEILKKNGVESFIDDSEGYFDTIEINVFMNLLSIIDNSLQDVELISVLHSEIFGFSAEELGRVRSENKEGQYAECFIKYSENGKNDGLQLKCRNAVERIREWKERSCYMELPKFIWQLLIETGYYLQMGALPGGTQRQANLRTLVDRAENFSSDKQGSLYSFVRYIGALKSRKVSIGQVKLIGENDDIVRIMTIHKSKGLEFPMVIVAGMGKKLNYSKLSYGVNIHKDIGVGMTLVNHKEHWYKQTLIQKLIQNRVKKEEIAEEIRVLYVALTRAKDVLYMTGTTKNSEKLMAGYDMGINNDSCYLEMMEVKEVMPNLKVVKGAQLSFDQSEPVEMETKSGIFEDTPTEERRREVFRRLDYVYPFEIDRKRKSKYSVTELNQLQNISTKTTDINISVPKFRQGERKFTPVEMGNIYHGIMERIDFSEAFEQGTIYIEKAISEYIKKEIFTEEEIEAVDLRKIKDFFDTDLGKRCKTAFENGILYRERPFDLTTNYDGKEVIVQGIIDCYFEEEDGFILIDYKSNSVNPNIPAKVMEKKLKEEYKEQLNIYSKALESSKGKPVKEAYLYLFTVGKMIRM